MTKPTAFLSKEEVKTNIKAIATTAAVWLNLVQDTAIACMYHAREHGDVTLAQTLIFAIPATEKRTQQRAQLVSWFGTYSPIVVKNETDWPGKLNKSGKVAERGFRIDDADKNPWYLHGDKKTEDKQPLSLHKLIEMYHSFAKRIDTAIEKNEVAASDILAARMFATHIRGVALPDFKIEAYLENERLACEADMKDNAPERNAPERSEDSEDTETTDNGETINPVAKNAPERSEEPDINPAQPEQKAA